jgi:hypothetical protein
MTVAFFPKWGKYLVGERLCESMVSSWLYLPVAISVVVAFIAGAVLIPALVKRKAPFLRGSPETRRIRKEGRPATAIIVAVGESDEGGKELPGGFENVALTLEIDDGVHSPYLVSVDSVVPYSVKAQCQPDAVINVKVDKDDPEKVILVK